MLRAYHGRVGELIAAHGGTLEHFAGDGMMVFFNDPVAARRARAAAIRLALDAQERFDELAAGWRKRGTELGLGIGIAGGLRDARAHRLRGPLRLRRARLGREHGIAAEHDREAGPDPRSAQRVFAAVEETIEAQPVGELELKGFSRPIAAYEVLGLR